MFISSFGPGLPYIIIIFCYVMILRKYRQSRNKVLGHSSASLKSRNSLTDRERRMSKMMETSFFEKRKKKD